MSAYGFAIWLLTFSWCVHDRDQNDLRLRRIRIFLTAGFAPLSMPVYFVGTRGWRRGIIATLWLAGFILAVFASFIFVAFCIAAVVPEPSVFDSH